MRHYAIRASPVGLDKKIKKVVLDSRKIPNLRRYKDVSDYILGNAALSDSSVGSKSANISDSETEDEANNVILPQTYIGKGNTKQQKSALKLVELGPRLRLKLYKVQRELGKGEVMYHAYVKKSNKEIKDLKTQKIEKDLLKQK